MMKDELKYSFSSANTFPMKLIRNLDILESCILDKNVLSVHYQLNPTNKCNFNCEFCSCSERNRRLELSLKQIDYIFRIALRYGVQSTTITGGGEPLMFKDFNEMIKIINDKDIDVGLVTNGTLLNKINVLDKIIWIRISVSDIYSKQLMILNKNIGEQILEWRKIIKDNNNIDWSFSYVLGHKPNYKLIARLIEFANEQNFTHFRLVNDIFLANELRDKMNYVRSYLKFKNVDDSIVNYQDRSYWMEGSNPCYISLLKPVIGADGYIYPCCGTQYALNEPSKDYEFLMRMGNIRDLDNILKRQRFFDGSICYKCYYSEYNRALDILLNGLKHESFI